MWAGTPPLLLLRLLWWACGVVVARALLPLLLRVLRRDWPDRLLPAMVAGALVLAAPLGGRLEGRRAAVPAIEFKSSIS